MTTETHVTPSQLAPLIAKGHQLQAQRNWLQLRRVAYQLAGLTQGGPLDEYLLGLQWISTACRRLGDLQTSILASEEILKVAPLERRSLRSAIADNLGTMLTTVGRYDEARQRFAEAMTFEDTVEGRLAITENWAGLYAELGELRKAVKTYDARIAALEKLGPSEELGTALDNAAVAVGRFGDLRAALEMFERARDLMGPEASVEARVINAMSRANTLAALRDQEQAAAAFTEAYDVAFEWARSQVDRQYYREGFAALSSDVLRCIEAVRLRAQANEGGRLSDLGDIPRAVNTLNEVVSNAGALGLATPELLAWSALAVLEDNGADIHLPCGPLGALARASALLHAQLDIEASAPGVGSWPPTVDTGTLDNGLGVMARNAFADRLAREHFEVAAARARELGQLPKLANRLGNLIGALDKLGADATEPVQELMGLADSDEVARAGRIVAHKVLGEHLALAGDDAGAFDHLKTARDLIEQWRLELPPGTARSDILSNQYNNIPNLISRLLVKAGDIEGAFNNLQTIRGRRLGDALAARLGTPDSPMTVAEINNRLKKLPDGSGTVLVEIIADDEGLTAYLVSDAGVSRVSVPGDVSPYTQAELVDVHERERRLVQRCLDGGLLGGLAKAIEAEVPEDAKLLLVPDPGLANFPLHLVRIDSGHWCDRRSISYLPATSALRIPPDTTSWNGNRLVAGDSSQHMALPYARLECAEVANLLGVKPLVGPGECTAKAVTDALAGGDFDVVHLAVHGCGDPRHGGRASLLLGDDEWVAFDELAGIPWKSELVVFSGCSTGVAGLRNNREMLGVAQAAIAAGASAVIGCLWPVGDETAELFMRAFYEWYVPHRKAGAVDLREGIEVARNALREWLDTKGVGESRRRDGRSAVADDDDDEPQPEVAPELVKLTAWAPFVLFGSPVVGTE